MKSISRNGIVALCILGALIVTALVMYGKLNSINNHLAVVEPQLSAQYLDNQNELSAYVSGFYEQTGLAAAKSAQMDKILTDAVKGRYDKGSTAAPANGQLISAMVEAYPDLKGLDSYDKIIAYVQSGRTAYKDKQSKLLDMLRAYDTYRNTGLVNKRLVAMMGAPTSDLKAQIGTTVLHGKAAEAKMYQIVLAPGAKAAYSTGEMAPLTVQ